MGVRVCHDMAEGIRDADVIIMLRLQNERMSGAMLPSAGEFFKSYGLTPEKLALAKPDAIVMHPGPDQPRRRDRLGGGRRRAQRDPAAGDLRHRGAHGGDVDHRGERGMKILDHATAALIDPASGRDEHRRSGHRRGPHRRHRRCQRRLPRRPHDRRHAAWSSRRAWSTWPRGCASRATSTRACSRANCGRGGRRRHQPGLPARHRSAARRAGPGGDAEVPRPQAQPLPAVPARCADARPGRRGADRDGRTDRGRLRRLLAGRRAR